MKQVGEYDRNEFEEKNNFAGKVNTIAKRPFRMVALDLQPMVAEAFLKKETTSFVGWKT